MANLFYLAGAVLCGGGSICFAIGTLKNMGML